MKKKAIIRNRCYKAEFKVGRMAELSFLDYHIVADRAIIQEVSDALHKIEEKYPKLWEKDKR